MSENKSKNIVIIALCITLIFMGVGFSLLSQTLTINGTASVDSNASWNVQIESIKPVSGKYGSTDLSTSAALEALFGVVGTDGTHGTITKTSNTEFSFDVEFNEPGDYVVYEVKVKNPGTIDAKLVSAVGGSTSGITMSSDPAYDDDEQNNIVGTDKIFGMDFVTSAAGTTTTTVSSLTSNASVLVAGASVANNNADTYYVKVTFNEPTTSINEIPDAEASGTVLLVYQQAPSHS